MSFPGVAAPRTPAGHISEYGFEDIDLPITRVVEEAGLTRPTRRVLEFHEKDPE